MILAKTGFWLDTIQVGTDCPVRIAGVVNLSPESFYSESVVTQRDHVAAVSEAMASDGADFVDVGAMSTAPYKETAVSAAEEIRRLEAAIPVIRTNSGLPVSVDTKRADVAAAALAAGATIVNDVSGLHDDPAMAAIAAKANGVILMAIERPRAPMDPIGQVTFSWQSSLALAAQAGIDPQRIVLDPGIGFFRSGPLPWHEWDLQVLRNLPALTEQGHPLFVGVSRKSFIGERLQRPDPADRLAGSLAATALIVASGGAVIRTHDVRATRDAVRMAALIVGRPV